MASAEKRAHSNTSTADEERTEKEEKTTTIPDSNNSEPSSSKKLKTDELPADEEYWKNSCRRVIAILPGTGKGTLDNGVESSDDELSDTRSEGVLETSTDSSEYDEGIPFPTKPKVVIKKSAEQSHSTEH